MGLAVKMIHSVFKSLFMMTLILSNIYADNTPPELSMSGITQIAGGWNSLGDAGFSVSSVLYPSIAIDNTNTPYVVYSSGKATVMKYNGTSWEAVGVAGFSADGLENSSIIFDSNNIPYVVYKDYANSSKATVMKYDGTSWVNVGSAGFSAGMADYLSIAIDNTNTPYVVYRDYANSSKATVMKYNGTSWVNVGVAGFSAGKVYYSSIAIDSNNIPYVVYFDDANGGKATVMKYNGTSWETVGVAGFSADGTENTKIALDSSNTPYVVYTDYANGGKATVMKYNGTSWETVGSAGFSAGYVTDPSMAFDSANTLYVVYKDFENDIKATVMKYDGTSWETVGVAGFSAGEAKYLSIAIDSNNIPYVSYQDVGYDYAATVMKLRIGVNSINIPENQTAIIDLNATDIDNDSLMFSIGGVDANLFDIDSKTGMLSFKTAPNFEIPSDNGEDNTYNIVVSVNDGNDGENNISLQVNVTNGNDAPTITSTATITVDEDSGYSYTLSGSDIDGDNLIWSVEDGTTLPSWLTFSSGAIVNTVAGTTNGFADGNSSIAQFFYPRGVAVDGSGNIFVADSNNNRIRKIDTNGNVSTVAGATQGFEDGDSATAKFYVPNGVAVDGNGNIFVADSANNKIRKIDINGNVTTVAGTTAGFTDGNSTTAQFNYPYGIAVDASGNIFVADRNNHKIRKIDTSGNVTTVAGTTQGFADGNSTTAKFNTPMGVSVDGNGNIFVADGGNHKIRKIDTSGNVTTVAGTTYGFADGNSTTAQFSFPNGLTVDNSGNIFVADTNNNKLRKIDINGNVTTVAESDGDSGGEFSVPNLSFDGVALDSSGNIFIADTSNNKIRKITLDSKLNGTPTTAGVYDVNLTLSDGENNVTHNFQITVNNVNDIPTDITLSSATFAENSATGTTIGTLSAVDDDSSDTHTFSFCGGVNDGNFTIDGTTLKSNYSFDYETTTSQSVCVRVTDSADATFDKNITIAITNVNETPIITSTATTTVDEDNGYSYTLSGSDIDGDKLIWSVEDGTTLPSWLTFSSGAIVNTVAGSGIGLEDGNNIDARFYSPRDIAVDSSGNIFIADTSNNKIRKIDTNGNVTTFVGTTRGFADGNSTTAQFRSPSGVAVDSSGNIFVADTTNNRIRKIDSSGNVTTVAGSSSGGFADGNSTSAQFNNPYGVAVDVSGNIFVADTNNHKIRQIDSNGNVTTVAGTTSGFADGNSATAQFYAPYGVVVDGNGNIFVADTNNHKIRKIDTNGNVTTVAGTTSGFADGNSTTAQFAFPSGLIVDNSGNIFVADFGNNKIRKIDINGMVTTVAGTILGFADGESTTTAKFYNPMGIEVDSSGNIFVADTNNQRIRKITSGTKLSGTPTSPGIYDVNLTLSDGENNVTHNFTITVNNVNDIPTLGTISNIIKSEDFTTFNLTINPADIDGDNLKLSVDMNDSSIISIPTNSTDWITSANYSDGLILPITAIANKSGIVELNVTVEDSSGAKTSKLFTIMVNPSDDAPIASSMAATVGPNSANTFDTFVPNFSDIDGDNPIMLRIVTLPTVGTFEFTNDNGLTWTQITTVPFEVAMGDLANYRFNAGDNSGRTSDVNWSIVTDGNTTLSSNVATGVVTIIDPALNHAPDVNITMGENDINGTTVTIDEDGETNPIYITFSDDYTPTAFLVGVIDSNNTSKVSLADGDFNITRLADNNVSVIITPKANVYGDITITLGAFDGDKNGTKSFTLHINSVNDTPTALNFEKTIDEDTNYSFSTLNPTTVYSDTNDSIQNSNETYPDIFQIVSLPGHGILHLGDINTPLVADTNVSLANLGNLVYTPSENNNTDVTFTWRAFDGESWTEIKTATILINAVDDAPTLNTVATQNINEDASDFNITLVSSDVEGDTITYTVTSSDSSKVRVSIVNGKLVVTPIGNKSGTVTVELNAIANGKTTTKTFEVSITGVNDAPTIETSFSTISILEDSGVTNFELGVSDVDGDDLNVTVSSSNPNIVTVHPSWNGLVNIASYQGLDFNISTVPNANGIATITLTLKDNSGATDTTTFDINVTAINDAPTLATLSNVIVYKNSGDKNITVVASDVENSPLSYNAVAVDSSLFDSITFANNIMKVALKDNVTGNSDINVTVTDGTLNASKVFNFYVLPLEDGTDTAKVNDINVTTENTTTTTSLNISETLTIQTQEDTNGIVSHDIVVNGKEIKATSQIVGSVAEFTDNGVHTTYNSGGGVNLEVNATLDGKATHTLTTTNGTTTATSEFVGAQTVIKKNNNQVEIETSVAIDLTTTIKVTAREDGTAEHSVIKGTKETKATSTIAGATTKITSSGTVETSAGGASNNGYTIKAKVVTDENGKSRTSFVKVKDSDKTETSLGNTVKTTTPFEAGNSVEIQDIDGTLYIKTSAPLDANLVIE